MLLWIEIAQATTVALPAGEPVAEWAAAASATGVTIVRAGAEVEVSAEGEAWRLTVTPGGVTVRVARPLTREAREAVLVLAESLASPLGGRRRTAPPPQPGPEPGVAPGVAAPATLPIVSSSGRVRPPATARSRAAPPVAPEPLGSASPPPAQPDEAPPAAPSPPPSEPLAVAEPAPPAPPPSEPLAVAEPAAPAPPPSEPLAVAEPSPPTPAPAAAPAEPPGAPATASSTTVRPLLTLGPATQVRFDGELLGAGSVTAGLALPNTLGARLALDAGLPTTPPAAPDGTEVTRFALHADLIFGGPVYAMAGGGAGVAGWSRRDTTWTLFPILTAGGGARLGLGAVAGHLVFPDGHQTCPRPRVCVPAGGGRPVRGLAPDRHPMVPPPGRAGRGPG